MNAEVTTKARVLSAADALFYQHGVQAVGMDRIRDASGVSLKRIYQCFPSKGALVEAYLRRRDKWARTALEEHVALHTDPGERVLAVFDWLYDWFDGPDFHGCAFINAFGELGADSEAVADAVRDHKTAVRQYLRDLTQEIGAPEPGWLADQLAVLLDGAMSTASITDSPLPAHHARAAASTLLGAAVPGHAPSTPAPTHAPAPQAAPATPEVPAVLETPDAPATPDTSEVAVSPATATLAIPGPGGAAQDSR